MTDALASLRAAVEAMTVGEWGVGSTSQRGESRLCFGVTSRGYWQRELQMPTADAAGIVAIERDAKEQR